jgi:predicted TIM-barrel fold metal-dependent hydrolase
VIIDVHHHLLDEADYVPRLLDECDRLSIDRVCLFGVSTLPGNFFSKGARLAPTAPVTNLEVERACTQHPDRLIPFGFVRPGYDPPELVDELYDRGFKGLKLMYPRTAYDDRANYPVYERAEKRGLPCLFHTGFVMRVSSDGANDVSSNGMQPVHLDAVARRFPDLAIIAAHLGNGYHIEASWLARMNPNVYLDLTMARYGWRAQVGPHFIRELLWWPGAWERIVFGTDVHHSEMEHMLKEQRQLFGALNIPQETQERIFGATMARLLGLKPDL